MNILTVLDSSPIHKQLSPEDDPRLVKLVLGHYAVCIHRYARLPIGSSWVGFIESYVEDAYLDLVMSDGKDFGCISDEGLVTNFHGRFCELMEVCINTFTVDLVMQINALRNEGKKIVTISVIDYDKYIFKLIIKVKSK